MSLAEWIWGTSERSAGSDNLGYSPDLCVSSLPSMPRPCWSQLIAKLLGAAIIIGACLSKAPIVRNLLKSQSSAGFTRSAVLCEVVVTANAAIYGLLQGFPFTAYGENVALMIQSILIAILTYRFTEEPVSLAERASVLAAFSVYLMFTCWLLPSDYRFLLITSNLPIACYARGAMILEAMRLQHTGSQSVTTNALNLVGCVIRILTTIQEVGWDLAVLAGFFLGATLNFILVVQYGYYRENTERFLRYLMKKKKA